jgi:hypothetical protein
MASGCERTGPTGGRARRRPRPRAWLAALGAAGLLALGAGVVPAWWLTYLDAFPGADLAAADRIAASFAPA